MQLITLCELLKCTSPFVVPYQDAGPSTSSLSPDDTTPSKRLPRSGNGQVESSSLASSASLPASVVRSGDGCILQSDHDSKKQKRVLDGSVTTKKLKLDTGAREKNAVGETGSFTKDWPFLVPSSERSIILRGRIQLWNSSSHESVCPLKFDCLAFVDGTATVCCVLKSLNPQLLGCLVQLVSWNYIPVKSGGACLEIQRLELIEPPGIASPYLSPASASARNELLETPPFKPKKGNARLAAAGSLRFMSSMFVLPCKDSRGRILHHSVQNSERKVVKPLPMSSTEDMQSAPSETMQGFFVGLFNCKHSPPCSPTVISSPEAAVHIYFSGSVGAWRSILSTALGHCVNITGLRPKMLLVGPERKLYQVLAATRSTLVSLLLYVSTPIDARNGSSEISLEFGSDIITVEKVVGNSASKGPQRTVSALLFGEGRKCDKRMGSYIGVVTNIFMQGGLLELDYRVCLLLTHQALTQVHGLRVGAQVIARHVHIVNIKSSWEKVLLLGACFISHVAVIGFSPLRTPHVARLSSGSRLSRYIESLPFMWAFWALQLIASFRQKFRGVCSDKAILGSSKTEGFLHKYISSFVKESVSQKRDVFKEFFFHDEYCCLGDLCYGGFLQQVPPIAYFCRQVHALWEDSNSLLWQRSGNLPKCNDHLDFLEGTSRNSSLRQDMRHGNTIFRRVISSEELGVILLGFLQFSVVSAKLQLVDASGALDVLIPDLQSAHFIQQTLQITSFSLVIEAYEGSFIKERREDFSLILPWSNVFKGLDFSSECVRPIYFYIVFFMKEAYSVQLPMQIVPDFNVAEQMTHKDLILHGEEHKLDGSKFHVLLVTYKYPVRLKHFAEGMNINQRSFAAEAMILPYNILIPCDNDVHAHLDNSQHAHELYVYCISLACALRGHEKVEQMSERALIPIMRKYEPLCSCTAIIPQFERTGMVAVPEMRKIVIHFFDHSVHYHQVLKLGQCYLINSLRDCSANVTIDASNPLWSLAVVSCSNQEIPGVGKRQGMQLVDAILKVPETFLCAHNDSVNKARAYIKAVMDVRQARDEAVTLKRPKLNTEDGVLEGSLVSFYGSIEHIQPHKSKNPTKDSLFHKGFMQIHVIVHVKDLKNGPTVQVACDFHGYAWPIGLGPGVIASFHRVLLQRKSHGVLTFQTIPTTLIIVHSIREMGSLLMQKSLSFGDLDCWLHENERKQGNENIDAIFRLITQHSIIDTVKVHCKVISVRKLVLHRHGNKILESAESHHSNIPDYLNYRITFASFIVDDGSGLAQCWATDERAAYLLNLPSLTGESHIPSVKASPSATLAQQLGILLKKYQKLKLKNDSCALDYASDSYVIRGDVDQILNDKEEKVIHSIVQRACHAGPLTITAKPLHKAGSEKTGGKGQSVYEVAVIINGGHAIHTITYTRPLFFVKTVDRMNYIHDLNIRTQELSFLLN